MIASGGRISANNRGKMAGLQIEINSYNSGISDGLLTTDAYTE